MRAGQSEGRGVKELRDQATTALQAARGAESGAEAAKVGAEGNALLLRARADELQLESQQLTVQSAQLAIENEREVKSFEDREVDREILAQGFRAIRPMR